MKEKLNEQRKQRKIGRVLKGFLEVIIALLCSTFHVKFSYGWESLVLFFFSTFKS